MRIAKILVLMFVLSITGYVYASDAGKTPAKESKAAACKTDGCCKAKQECCVPGAECCKQNADCCVASESCCTPDQKCRNCGDTCCAAGTDQKRAQCCAGGVCSSKPEGKNCCETGCKTAAHK